MAGPTLADRVLVLEEGVKPLHEFRRWGIAIIAGGFLSVVAGAIAVGQLIERTDNVAAEVQELRRDLAARGEVPSVRSRGY